MVLIRRTCRVDNFSHGTYMPPRAQHITQATRESTKTRESKFKPVKHGGKHKQYKPRRRGFFSFYTVASTGTDRSESFLSHAGTRAVGVADLWRGNWKGGSG